jgi:hypothetical protein
MSFITLLFGKFFLMTSLSFTVFNPVVSILKFFPFFLSLLFFIFLYFSLQFPSRTHKFSFYMFSNMLYLTNLCISFSSHFYLNWLFKRVKVYEYGLKNFVFNKTFSFSYIFISNYMFKFVLNLNPLLRIFLVFFFVVLLWF